MEELVLKYNVVKLDWLRGEESKKNNELFWNLVYYFYEYALPFEFILPYEQDKDEDAAVAAYSKKTTG